ncbi:MAG: hypothetical protein EBU90_11540 [Proteobacteria bacterium]|nr:hypothetical protein [Pseudomonadota bacterium]NBP14612.1 hypothetical protein [bacterium]
MSHFNGYLMFIEDIILNVVSNNLKLNRYDQPILESFSKQLYMSNPLTNKQGDLALKILKRYQSRINQLLQTDITSYIENPNFKFGKRTIPDLKLIKICSNAEFGKEISVEFPFNDEIIAKIRSERTNLLYCSWDAENKRWIFGLDEKSLSFLFDISKQFGFQVDEEVAIYFEEIQSIRQNFENFVPIISFDEGYYKFKNFSRQIPEKLNKNLEQSLFYGRKLGITVWDEHIESELDKNLQNSVIKNFLDKKPEEKFHYDLEKYEEKEVFDIIKHLMPCLAIVPVNQELETTQKLVTMLNNNGIVNEEISILFRLPNETQSDFNLYVKKNGLNNPISDNIKFYIISYKIPKTLYTNKVKLHSVLNYNFYNLHYTIQEFLKTQENVIYCQRKTEKKEKFWDTVI